jgi:hypothetical protein
LLFLQPVYPLLRLRQNAGIIRQLLRLLFCLLQLLLHLFGESDLADDDH